MAAAKTVPAASLFGPVRAVRPNSVVRSWTDAEVLDLVLLQNMLWPIECHAAMARKLEREARLGAAVA